MGRVIVHSQIDNSSHLFVLKGLEHINSVIVEEWLKNGKITSTQDSQLILKIFRGD